MFKDNVFAHFKKQKPDAGLSRLKVNMMYTDTSDTD